MGEERALGSVLMADIGMTSTHVNLIERVDGVYRLVARTESRTTLSGTERDVTIGLVRAISQIEEAVQRPLMADDGLVLPEETSGVGVDAFLATCSAAKPLCAVIVGLTDRLSVESARHACAVSPVQVRDTIALGARFRNWEDEALSTLYGDPPDLIILVGGSDSGSVAPLTSAASVLTTLYESLEAERRPVIVFAGNLEARRPISDIMAPVFDFRVVDNVRRNARVESYGELQREIMLLYETVALPRLPGYAQLSAWATVPVRATAEALSGTIRFVARRMGVRQGALSADVGGAWTHIAAARGDVYQWAICAGMGTSHGLEGVLERVKPEGIDRWLPKHLENDEIVARLTNARLRPHSVAQSPEEMLLLHGVLREALSLATDAMWAQHWAHADASPRGRQTPPFDLIAVRGGLIAHTTEESLVALSLLDALQPVGLGRMVIDWASVWPQLSLLAQIEPLAALQVLEHDAFRDLGTVIAPQGRPSKGTAALLITMVRDTGETSKIEIPPHTVTRIPLARGDQATLEVRPSRGYDIGLGRRGVGGRATVQGGGLGIIIDTRGRPLQLPEDTEVRRQKLVEWLRNLKGNGIPSL